MKFFWDQFSLFLSFYSTFLDSRSEEEKCCHNKGIPTDCHGLCTPDATDDTPVSSAGKLASGKHSNDVCNRFMDLIIECRDISKGMF